MFGADQVHEWLHSSSLGSSNYTGATTNGTAANVGDGQCLTNAIIHLIAATGGDSPTFQLQESASSVGTFTNITDANASIQMTGVGVAVINGQRQYEYCRVQMTQSNASDTISVSAVITDIRTQMPHGASGASISPA